MKSTTLPRSHVNTLHRLILDATNAPRKDLGCIENIMREEVFHSTLDWQSREQLICAAREAQARLNEDRELYDLDHACRVAMFHRLKAETAVRETNSTENQTVLMAAIERYEAAKAMLLDQLDKG